MDLCSNDAFCFSLFHLLQLNFEPFHHSVAKVEESEYGVGSGLLVSVI